MGREGEALFPQVWKTPAPACCKAGECQFYVSYICYHNSEDTIDAEEANFLTDDFDAG